MLKTHLEIKYNKPPFLNSLQSILNKKSCHDSHCCGKRCCAHPFPLKCSLINIGSHNQRWGTLQTERRTPVNCDCFDWSEQYINKISSTSFCYTKILGNPFVNFKGQAPVAQRLDNAIHWISVCKANCVIHWLVNNPVDSIIIWNNQGSDG